MKRKTFSLMFFLRKGRSKDNRRNIYLRITVDGLCAEISIKRSIDLQEWNIARGCAKNCSPYTKELNARLEQIRTQIYQHERNLIDRNKPVTAQALKDACLNIYDRGNRMVLQVYQEHNDDLKLKINKGVAYGTYERHVTSRKHLQSFIRAYKKNDYLLRDVVFQYQESLRFETYLYSAALQD